MSFSWTFVSQPRLKFEFCKHIWSKEVFLISTQWILSWLGNHHLIINCWLSSRDIILSVLIKSFDSLFTLYCTAHLQQLLTTLIRYKRELKNSYMYIYGYKIQTVIQWKTSSISLINIYSFVFLLDNHQLINDWFLIELFVLIKDLAVFHSSCHGECHSFSQLKRVSITLIWSKQ